VSCEKKGVQVLRLLIVIHHSNFREVQRDYVNTERRMDDLGDTI